MADARLKSAVGALAARRPQAIPVLERHDIDYCCGGEQTLDAACRRAGVSADEVLRDLDQIEQRDEQQSEDWTDSSLSRLCDHIVDTHHAFLRQQLPFLADLIDKVVAAHAVGHPELNDVRSKFKDLCAELGPHMMKEEQILFPAVRALEKSSSSIAFPFGTVRNPIGMMEHEHDVAGDALRRLRELTGGFSAPDDACNSFTALYDGLAGLEADLHEHIHKENNILFPRAAELEERLAARQVEPS